MSTDTTSIADLVDPATVPSSTTQRRADDAELRAAFDPVLAEIARGAVDREADRRLPFDEVEALRRVGFTRLSVPVEHGGHGRSVSELFAWLVDLAAADSNLPQLLRAHFAFVEAYASAASSPERARVLDLAGAGAIFGNASHERAGADVGSYSTALRETPEGWRLSGTKYYSTGSLFADHVAVVAQLEDGAVRSVLLPTTTEGVELVDDWDGFGQRLTGSGTTHLHDVHVEPEQISERSWGAPSHVTPFVQLVLLAALAGTSRAIARDAADFVRSRTRVYSQGSGDVARLDPLVQQVVGRLSSAAFAAEAIVGRAAAVLETASTRAADGPDLAAVEAAELATVQAQVALIPLVLTAAGELFEVGGASATSVSRQLDRHWRNARTLASHNPAIYQQRAIGDHRINGADLIFSWATGTGAGSAA